MSVGLLIGILIGAALAAAVLYALILAVNLGGATAADVQDLLRQVSDIVYEKSGIRLEPEVRIW